MRQNFVPAGRGASDDARANRQAGEEQRNAKASRAM